jgi:hypothetical protein
VRIGHTLLVSEIGLVKIYASEPIELNYLHSLSFFFA